MLAASCTLVRPAEYSKDDITRGQQLFERGQVVAARQFFESFTTQHPQNPAGAFYLGRIAFSAGQYEQAVQWLEKAVQLDDTNSDYHFWLGHAYGYQARRARSGEQFFIARKVRVHLERAVELNSDNLPARFDLMEYYLQAPLFLGGGLDKARSQAEEIAKRDEKEGTKAWERYKQFESAAQSGEAGQLPSDTAGDLL
jgi:tetratricopeptide (TPR) repeat protein